jgi:hypothetical protein
LFLSIYSSTLMSAEEFKGEGRWMDKGRISNKVTWEIGYVPI